MKERRDGNSGAILFTPGPRELEEKRIKDRLDRMEKLLEIIMDDLGLSEERKQRLRDRVADGR